MKRLNVVLWLVFSLFLCFSGNNVFANTVGGYEIPFYTGKILPTPQKVTYYDEFVPISDSIILLGKGIKEEDIIVKVLKERITEKGGNVETTSLFANALSPKYKKYKTIISLGETNINKQIKVPDKEEGYIITPIKKDKKDIIILKGKDKLGLLWSVISFNQLITEKEGKPVVRKADVYDYPVIKNRGYLTTPWSGTGSQWAWFNMQFKFNRLVFTRGNILEKKPSPTCDNLWRNEVPDDWKEELKRIGYVLNPVGIEWYVGICPIRGEQKIRSKNEDDFNAIFRAASLIAEAGGNIFILYDDTRFPLSPEDKKDFGSAREADIYFLNKLYTALKKKYPEVKMEFCPPFYWGPRAADMYPESRDEYLSAIGKRLPKEIDIVWTGPRVSSVEITKEDVEWITNFIQRKPCIWQNGIGAQHVYGYHYVTDPVSAWKDWYYDGFFNDVEAYGLYTNVPHACSALLTLVDYLWNPKAYQPEKSIEEATKKLCGVETYPALVKLNEKLTWFDKYGCRVSPGAAKNIVEIRKKVAELEDTWQECLKYHPESVKRWTSLEVHVNQQKTLLSGLEKNPNLSAFIRQEEDVKKLSKKEINFNPDVDIFLSPYDFSGGAVPILYSCYCEQRLCTWVYGAKTYINKMSANFNLPEPTTDYLLIISGQDDDGPDKCRIRITVNDNKVFEGENPFIQCGWSIYTFKIKANFLKEGENILTIQNIEDSAINTGPPFFMLNYAVIRKSE